MTEKTLEMQAVELVAMAREEGIIADFEEYKKKLKEKINDTMLSIDNVSEIRKDKPSMLDGLDITKIEKQIKENIIYNLEKAELL